MTHPTRTVMPSSCTTAPASPIAIACLGPSAQPLLAALNACPPPGVQLLAADALTSKAPQPSAGLLILVEQQALDADNQAMLALAQHPPCRFVGCTDKTTHPLCLSDLRWHAR
ncbi:MAG: hypothetical protein JSR53_06220 [Proteobacteria bacterium]|nr:hypothetical protein [Pseudomonadota bacterium]